MPGGKWIMEEPKEEKEKNIEPIEHTDLMTCKNCKYYKDGICTIDSFNKIKVNPNNFCASWEKDESIKEAYEILLYFLDKYMDMEKENERIIAIWILGALFHKNFESYPYLFINAMRGSGKTRLLKMIKSFLQGDMLASLTEAVLFRTTGALCIDEFEGINRKGTESLKELLNSAYKKGTKVKRMTKRKVNGQEKQVVEEFEPYRPIAIANIFGMEDVLGDRCINIILEKSNNPKKTRLVEIWEEEEEFKNFQKLAKKLIQCSLCSVVSIKNVYIEWNKFISYDEDNYTNYTTFINNNNYTNNTILTNNNNNDNIYIFERIKNSSIDGRFLEIGMPLFLTANLIDRSVFDQLINDFEVIVNKKKEDSLIENSDVSLYDFLSQEVESDSFTFINELTRKFREFSGITDEWLNEKWMGRALKRLNLLIEKKRVGRGVIVRINYQKAKEKIKIFK